MFKPFSHIPDFEYTKGWDRYALDYEKLLVPGTVYYLTKEVMHHLVDQQLGDKFNEHMDILDVNCGTGNDFPFFFNRGWNVIGCDGSEGMLNLAFENYRPYIETGELKLYSGMIENIKGTTFGNQQFDLIFSITGGFSYISDEQLKIVNDQLSGLLKKDGVLITAHLNKYCLPDMLYRLLHLKNPFYRMRSGLTVNIKGDTQRMYLRSSGHLESVYSKTFSKVNTLPLLSITPPYQSGFTPGKSLLQILNKLEKKISKYQYFSHIADQVVTVCKK